MSVDVLPQRNGRHRYSDEAIIERIQLWRKLVGRPPTKEDWTPSKLRRLIAKTRAQMQLLQERLDLYESGDFPAETTVRERFGSLNAALAQAGFQPRTTGRPAKLSTIPRHVAFGPRQLRLYFGRVVELRNPGVGTKADLKQALYDLAYSAIREADQTEP